MPAKDIGPERARAQPAAMAEAPPVPAPSAFGPERILALQRTAGNMAVGRMLQRMTLVEAMPNAEVEVLKHNNFAGEERGNIKQVAGTKVRVKFSSGDFAGTTADVDPAFLQLRGAAPAGPPPGFVAWVNGLGAQEQALVNGIKPRAQVALAAHPAPTRASFVAALTHQNTVAAQESAPNRAPAWRLDDFLNLDETRQVVLTARSTTCSGWRRSTRTHGRRRPAPPSGRRPAADGTEGRPRLRTARPSAQRRLAIHSRGDGLRRERQG